MTSATGISLKLHWLGVGDVVVCWTILNGLQEQNPGCEVNFVIEPGDNPGLAGHILDWARLGWTNCYMGPREIEGTTHHIGKPGDPEADPERLGAAGLRHDLWAARCGVVPRLPILTIPKRAEELADQKLQSLGVRTGKPLVYLSPVTANEWRNWPVAKWKELELMLHNLGLEVVIGALDSKPWISRKDLSSFLTPAFIGKIAPSVLAAILRRAHLIISNDSGIAHVGGVLRLPTIAICGGNYDGHAVFGWYPSVRVLQAESREIDKVEVSQVYETVVATLAGC